MKSIHLTLRRLFVTSCLALGACGGPAEPCTDDSAACTASADSRSAHGANLTRDQRSTDIQALQAWIAPTVGRRFGAGASVGDRLLDLTKCNANDCSAAAQLLIDSPLVGGFQYDSNRSGQCEVIEFRVVVREAALTQPSFAGLGAYLSHGSEMVSLSAELARGRAQAGRVTLRNGEAGQVLRFATQGTCFGLGGNTGSIMNRSYAFLPFVDFAAGADTYRVWERSANHVLGRTRDGAFVTSFDRQSDLLGR
jgi:hypothetical protein